MGGHTGPVWAVAFSRHSYKFNAFNSALFILAGLQAGTVMYGSSWIVWTYIWDKLLQITTANMLISTSTALFVYLRSFTVPHPGQANPEHRELAKGGHTGNMLNDWFIGRELNPRMTFPKWLAARHWVAGVG